jgi:hypothetical protein
LAAHILTVNISNIHFDISRDSEAALSWNFVANIKSESA